MKVGIVSKQRSPERFCFEKDLPGPPLAPGDYVEVALASGGTAVAIVESLRGDKTGYDYTGKLVREVGTEDLVGSSVRLTTPDVLSNLFRLSTGAPLVIGELARVPNHVRVALRGESLLERHSCVFGSSGSGKSMLLGLLVEEVLLKIPAAQVVIFDPNSDFSRFNTPRSKDEVNDPRNRCDTHMASTIDTAQRELLAATVKLHPAPQLSLQRFGAAELMDVLSSTYDPPAELLLTALWRTLPMRGIPITPSALLGLLEEPATRGNADRKLALDEVTLLLPHGAERAAALMKLQGLLRRTDTPLWSQTGQDSLDVLTASAPPRLIQFDLGSLPFRDRALFSECAFRILWKRNTTHCSHTFIVIDEAHNLCPTRAEYGWQQNTIEWVNRIAAEGRKYGLYLIVVSQRPANIHPNTFDNCRNFLVLRLQNREDIERLSRATVQLSGSLLSRVAVLQPHEAIVFGDASIPAVIRIGRRRMN